MTYCDGRCKVIAAPNVFAKADVCTVCTVQLGTSRSGTTDCGHNWGSNAVRTVDLNLCCIRHIPQTSKSLVSSMEISRRRQYNVVFLFIIVWRLIFPILAAWWKALGGRGGGGGGGHDMYCESCDGSCKSTCRTACLCKSWCTVQLGTSIQAAQPGAATTGCVYNWGSDTVRTVDLNLRCIWRIPLLRW